MQLHVICDGIEDINGRRYIVTIKNPENGRIFMDQIETDDFEEAIKAMEPDTIDWLKGELDAP